MPSFHGFPDGKTRLVSIPASFFSELLPEIDHLGELKITLHIFWQLSQMEGDFRYVRLSELEQDSHLLAGMAQAERSQKRALHEALERAVARGSLLKVSYVQGAKPDNVYFVNSPRGRAAVEAMNAGKWKPGAGEQPAARLEVDRPNIYRLYEQNIGPLTPMLAETLRDAETLYAEDWIQDAFRIALENNVRHWRYIEAILRSWKEKGRDEQDRREPEQNRRRYIEGEFAQFIEH